MDLSSDVVFDVPVSAHKVFEILASHGKSSYLVGGWVRDSVMGRATGDLDMCSAASWQEAKLWFEQAGYRVIETGVAHGTITLLIDRDAIELTTYRRESSYSDMRHPDSVQFVDRIEEDLARRDFTCNALAYNPELGLVDLFGGLDDISHKSLEAIGDPCTRFSEDALRIVRALRFTEKLGFSIEPHTEQALFACSDGLQTIAPERIGKELDSLFEACAQHRSVHVLERYKDILAPIVGIESYGAWMDTLKRLMSSDLDEVFASAVASRHIWAAALLCDRSAVTSFERFAVSRQTNRFLKAACALKAGYLQNDCMLESLSVSEVIKGVALTGRITGDRDAAYQDFKEFVGIAVAAGKCNEQILEILADAIHNNVPVTTNDLAISGADILSYLEPGPCVGKVLNACLEAIWSGSIENQKDELISFVHQWNKDNV